MSWQQDTYYCKNKNTYPWCWYPCQKALVSETLAPHASSVEEGLSFIQDTHTDKNPHKKEEVKKKEGRIQN